MTLFEHPLQLFTMEYPDAWEVRYQEDTGGVMLIHPGTADVSVLTISALAVSGPEVPLEAELAQAAARAGIRLQPELGHAERRGETRALYGEGLRDEPPFSGMSCRFWLVQHGLLRLYVTQLGPGAQSAPLREQADSVLRSLTFPELLPPTPAEFQERVLEVLAREYPDVAAAAEGVWMIRVEDRAGKPVGSIGLENLYRSCLLQAEATGAMIRNHLDQILHDPPETEALYQYAAVRERLLPMLKAKEWLQEIPGGEDLLKVDFASGMVMCFVVDEPTRVAYVTRGMLAEWDVPLERVQEVAQDNLAALNRELDAGVVEGEDGQPQALIFSMGDGYAAARICLPGVREAFAAELGDEFLVGMPGRDLLIAFSTRDPEAGAAIARQVRQGYHQMDHPLTPVIYRVRADSIEPIEL